MTRAQRTDGNTTAGSQRAASAIPTIAVSPETRPAEDEVRPAPRSRSFEMVAWDEV